MGPFSVPTEGGAETLAIGFGAVPCAAVPCGAEPDGFAPAPVLAPTPAPVPAPTPVLVPAPASVFILLKSSEFFCIVSVSDFVMMLVLFGFNLLNSFLYSGVPIFGNPDVFLDIGIKIIYYIIRLFFCLFTCFMM